jgi:hypothetical protein
MTAHKDPNRSITEPGPHGTWEEILRRGRDEDAGEEVAGSVESDLAYIHLMRHARRPEAMSDDDLDRVWREVDGAIAPERVPFWKRSWVRALMPVAGVAAAVLFVVVQSGDDATVATATQDAKQAEPGAVLEEAESAGGGAAASGQPARAAKVAAEPAAQAEAEPAEGDAALPSPAQILESQFQTLEPAARAQVNHSVDGGRGAMRSALLGQALGAGQP